MTQATRQALENIDQILSDAGWSDAGEVENAPGDQRLLQADFMIPVHRDPESSDGAPHAAATWDWLQTELLNRFDNCLSWPDSGETAWKSVKTGRSLRDQTKHYSVAVPDARLDELRSFLRTVGSSLQLQRIYLSSGGLAEYIDAEK